MAGASPLLAETPRPLCSEALGGLGPASFRAHKLRAGLPWRGTQRIIPAPPHRSASKTGVCPLATRPRHGLNGYVQRADRALAR